MPPRASAPRSPSRWPQDGWNVGVNYRSDKEGAEKTVKAIKDAGGNAIAIEGDVSDANGVADDLITKLEEEFGPVLALVNNAGITADGLAIQLEDDQWDRVIDTNLTAAFRMTRRAIRPMIKARFGRVINIASVVGPRANAGQSNYAAAKAGLIGMTKTVAAEVAKRGVTVNAVAPGLHRHGHDRGHSRRCHERRAGQAARHAGGGRRRRALPRLRRRRVRDRLDPVCRRRHERLDTQTTQTRERNQMPETVTPEAVETTVREALVQFGPEADDIKLEATFEELDVDSLDLAELSQIIEDEYGVKLKGEDVGKIKTVGDAVDLVVQRAG